MKENNTKLKSIKIGLLGDDAVGKTSICNSLAGLEFTEDTIATIGPEKIEVKFPLKDGNHIKLILWDTVGQERFRSVTFKAVRNIMNFILIFDVAHKTTLNNLDTWIQEISEKRKNINLILFGNKVDLPKERWEITNEEVKAYAEKHKLIYFETSAKTKQGINEGLTYFVNEIYGKIEENKNNIELDKKIEEKDKTNCVGKNKKTSKKG